MRCTVLPNGNLRITADNTLRAGLAQAYRDGGYYEAEGLIAEWFRQGDPLPGHCPEFIRPEMIGALTDAPIIAADADFPDDAEGFIPYDDSPVWWFPGYVVCDPWEELKNRGRVVFTRASKD